MKKAILFGAIFLQAFLLLQYLLQDLPQSIAHRSISLVDVIYLSIGLCLLAEVFLYRKHKQDTAAAIAGIWLVFFVFFAIAAFWAIHSVVG